MLTSVKADPDGQLLDDPHRLAALNASGLLDSEPEETFDRFTRLAARLLGCPMSFITLIDKDRQFFKSQMGMGEPWATRRETPMKYSLCQYVVQDGDTLAVDDAREDRRLRENLAVTEFGVVAYLGVPIRSDDGFLLGSFCVAKCEERAWSQEDVETLQDLGSALAAEIRLVQRGNTLRELLHEHEKFEMERERMLRLLVHDLRAPVGAVSAALDMLSEEAEGDGQKELVDLAHQGAEEVLGMINQILEVHRMEAGYPQLEPASMSVAGLLRSVFQQMLPMAEGKGQTLGVEYPETDFEIVADAGLLKRVLVNLLCNATKYAGGGAHIVLRGAKADGKARFQVEDNGPGIPVANRESIFRAFDRGGKTLEGKDTSFGLGLCFCRLVAEAHGGRIWVDESSSGGSLFQLEVPVQCVGSLRRESPPESGASAAQELLSERRQAEA